MKFVRTNCSLIGTGTWKFEVGQLRLYANGKEIKWWQVMKVPLRPRVGESMVMASIEKWTFLDQDTSAPY